MATSTMRLNVAPGKLRENEEAQRERPTLHLPFEVPVTDFPHQVTVAREESAGQSCYRIAFVYLLNPEEGCVSLNDDHVFAKLGTATGRLYEIVVRSSAVQEAADELEGLLQVQLAAAHQNRRKQVNLKLAISVLKKKLLSNLVAGISA